MLTETQKCTAIQSGYKLIKAAHGYSQVKVVKKLDQLAYKTNTTAFNKILKGGTVGTEVITQVFNGLQILLEMECCLVLNEVQVWEKIENQLPQIIPLKEDNPKAKEGFVFIAEGRPEPKDKVKFFQTATTHIVEFGTTLNAFTNYFISLRESGFKKPMFDLLAKGVNLQCYLLDPDWNGTSFYFDNRDAELEKDGSGIDKIRTSLRRLKVITKEIEAAQYSGRLEVFTYRCIPHNYFFAIDMEDKPKAKMMVSNYLFGESRANCPVMQFTRQDQPTLFIRYQSSLKKLMKSAKQVDFDKI